jgi:S-DNA-T family DNA segregation ATPase FtsK/SpoIIIE
VINSYLNNFLGSIGTATLLGTIILSTLVWIFNVDFNQIIPKKKLQALRTENDSPLPEAILDTPTPTRVKVINPQPIVNPSDIVNTVKKEEVEEKTFVQPEDTFTTVNPKNKQENNDAEGELTLDIVETADEEILENVEYGSIQSQYDPTLDLSGYEFPNLELMNNYGSDKIKIDPEELERNKDQIVQTLQNYNIDIQKIKATVGPTVTLYEIVPAPGVRISKIKNLEDDIALSLAALGIRIIAPIPGKGTIGIEVPNINKDTVSMRSLIASEKFQHAQMDLPIALGKTISNEIFVADLAKMPHLLVAGATGQGKSVGINSILISLLYKKHPSQLKFVMIDPKKVELSLYSKIEKHFLAKLPGEEDPIIVDTKKVINTLKALCVEMDLRYNLLKDAGVRNLNQYNEKFLNRKLNPENGHRYLPYIVLVIDEFADLIMTAGKEVEMPIARLAQLARAIGIHLIIATQRPSVNIITGTIKANFPARIAFRVQSKIDSRTILDQGGADQLIGRGDLLLSVGGDTIRLQCGFVDTPEAEKIVDFIGEQKGYPEAMLLPEVHDEEGDQMMDDFNLDDRDEFFDEAAHLIVSTQQGSTSLIQRKLKLGYNRAGRLMDQLEAAGVVGPVRGSKPREVLIKDIIHLEQFLGGKE